MAGFTNIAELDSGNGQRIYFDKKDVKIHPGWNHSYWKDPDFHDWNNDIAIIKLKEPVEWTDAVQPVCLPGYVVLHLGIWVDS